MAIDQTRKNTFVKARKNLEAAAVALNKAYTGTDRATVPTYGTTGDLLVAPVMEIAFNSLNDVSTKGKRDTYVEDASKFGNTNINAITTALNAPLQASSPLANSQESRAYDAAVKTYINALKEIGTYDYKHNYTAPAAGAGFLAGLTGAASNLTSRVLGGGSSSATPAASAAANAAAATTTRLRPASPTPAKRATLANNELNNILTHLEKFGLTVKSNEAEITYSKIELNADPSNKEITITLQLPDAKKTEVQALLNKLLTNAGTVHGTQTSDNTTILQKAAGGDYTEIDVDGDEQTTSCVTTTIKFDSIKALQGFVQSLEAEVAEKKAADQKAGQNTFQAQQKLQQQIIPALRACEFDVQDNAQNIHYYKAEADAAGKITVNLQLERMDAAIAKTWLNMQLWTDGSTPVLGTMLASPVDADLQYIDGTTCQDEDGNTVHCTTTSITFVDTKALDAFAKKLQATAKDQRQDEKNTRLLGKILAIKLAASGIAEENVVYSLNSNLKHEIHFKEVTAEQQNHIAALAMSAEFPMTVIAGWKTRTPPAGDTTGEYVVEFSDPTVIQPLLNGLESNATIGLQRNNDTKLHEGLESVAQSITDAIKSSDSMVRRDQVAVAGTKEDKYLMSTDGKREFVTISFTAPDAYFKDIGTAPNTTPSPFRETFAKFEQSKNARLTVKPATAGNQSISLTVANNAEGLQAARKFEEQLKGEVKIDREKDPEYSKTRIGIYRGIRAIPYLLITPFVPLLIVAYTVLQAGYRGLQVWSDAETPPSGVNNNFWARWAWSIEQHQNYLHNQEAKGGINYLLNLVYYPFAKSNFVSHMLNRWQTFNIFGAQKNNVQLLNGSYGMQAFGVFMMLLNFPVDILVSTVSTVLRNVFNLDPNGEYELMAKRALTYVWTSVFAFATLWTGIGAIAAGIGSSVGIWNTTAAVGGWVMKNIVGTLVIAPFKTLLTTFGGGAFFGTTGFPIVAFTFLGVLFIGACAAVAHYFWSKGEADTTATSSATTALIDPDAVPEQAAILNNADQMPGLKDTTKTEIEAEAGRETTPEPQYGEPNRPAPAATLLSAAANAAPPAAGWRRTPAARPPTGGGGTTRHNGHN